RTDEERRAVQSRLATARHDFGQSTQRSLERWYPGDSSVSGELVQQTRKVLESNDIDSFLYAYEVFASADREIAPELVRLQQPLLAMTGECDPGSTPDMNRRLVNAVPNGTLRVVPKARHML